MKTSQLTDAQKKALMDLLIVGMYADHSLASAEDASVQRLLDTFQFQSDYDRQSFSDAAFTRASRHATSPEAIRAYVTQLAVNFPAREMRQNAYDILENLLTSDGRTTSEESQLLSVAKKVFQL